MEIDLWFENRPISFKDPYAIIKCDHPGDLQDSFRELETLIDKGYYLAGFFSYEAGYALEERLRDDTSRDFPLLMMGAFKRPCDHPASSNAKDLRVSDLTINTPKEAYSRDIDEIRRFISIGDVYQITYCIKMKFRFKGDPLSLHNALYLAQPVPYSAYIYTDEFSIMSLSPERFIKKSGDRILSEPMKGTWWRGKNIVSDRLERYRFSKDMKNRAENIMIADLLRNDLGRVGTEIRAPKLFTITGYRTLFQMTSTVTGKVSVGLKLYDLFQATFPSGSVTGAPRIRAMEIIRELEREDRRIYTGAIGYVTPDRDMYFNIPIRTILLRGDEGEMGIGGGIVWDSTPDGEWNEGLLKARFLTDICD